MVCSQWERVPSSRQSKLVRSQSLQKLGLFLCVCLPLLAGSGLFLSALIPGCNIGGSGGPASRCNLFGSISVNWFPQLMLTALVSCMFTVPLGVVLWLIGRIGENFGKPAGDERQD
jgi:hypothetical protein